MQIGGGGVLQVRERRRPLSGADACKWGGAAGRGPSCRKAAGPEPGPGRGGRQPAGGVQRVCAGRREATAAGSGAPITHRAAPGRAGGRRGLPPRQGRARRHFRPGALAPPPPGRAPGGPRAAPAQSRPKGLLGVVVYDLEEGRGRELGLPGTRPTYPCRGRAEGLQGLQSKARAWHAPSASWSAPSRKGLAPSCSLHPPPRVRFIAAAGKVGRRESGSLLHTKGIPKPATEGAKGDARPWKPAHPNPKSRSASCLGQSHY